MVRKIIAVNKTRYGLPLLLLPFFCYWFSFLENTFMTVIYKDDIPVVHSYSEIGVPVIYAESYEQRLERRFEWTDKNHKSCNVIALRERPEGNYAVKEQFLASNLVTDLGEIYYAQKSAGETPTTDFGANGRFALRTGSATPNETDDWDQFTTPIAGSYATADDAGYPKTNDTADADNTGDGVNVVSWRKSWTTSDFNSTGIIGVAIIATASPTTNTPILNHASITSFDKTSSDTLKMFVNHQLET